MSAVLDSEPLLAGTPGLSERVLEEGEGEPSALLRERGLPMGGEGSFIERSLELGEGLGDLLELLMDYHLDYL